jgi:hypothetical protein
MKRGYELALFYYYFSWVSLIGRGGPTFIAHLGLIPLLFSATGLDLGVWDKELAKSRFILALRSASPPDLVELNGAKEVRQ